MYIKILFHRFPPEYSRSEDTKRADSLRSFTRQDKRGLQRNWPSTSAKYRMSWRKFLQVCNYSTPLDRESNTYLYEYHYYDESHSAKGQRRNR